MLTAFLDWMNDPSGPDRWMALLIFLAWLALGFSMYLNRPNGPRN